MKRSIFAGGVCINQLTSLSVSPVIFGIPFKSTKYVLKNYKQNISRMRETFECKHLILIKNVFEHKFSHLFNR